MRMDEDGNVVPGKMVDMVVEGQDVYIVSWPEAYLEDCVMANVTPRP